MYTCKFIGKIFQTYLYLFLINYHIVIENRIFAFSVVVPLGIYFRVRCTLNLRLKLLVIKCNMKYRFVVPYRNESIMIRVTNISLSIGSRFVTLLCIFDYEATITVTKFVVNSTSAYIVSQFTQTQFAKTLFSTNTQIMCTFSRNITCYVDMYYVCNM